MMNVINQIFGELSHFAFVVLALLVAAIFVVVGIYSWRAKRNGQAPTVQGAEQAVKDAADAVKKEIG